LIPRPRLHPRGDLAAVPRRRTISLHDSRQTAQPAPLTRWLTALRLPDRGSLAVTASHKRRRSSPDSGAIVHKLPHPAGVRADWHPTGELVAVACADRRVYGGNSQVRQRAVLDATGPGRRMRFSPTRAAIPAVGIRPSACGTCIAGNRWPAPQAGGFPDPLGRWLDCRCVLAVVEFARTAHRPLVSPEESHPPRHVLARWPILAVVTKADCFWDIAQCVEGFQPSARRPHGNNSPGRRKLIERPRASRRPAPCAGARQGNGGRVGPPTLAAPPEWSNLSGSAFIQRAVAIRHCRCIRGATGASTCPPGPTSFISGARIATVPTASALTTRAGAYLGHSVEPPSDPCHSTSGRRGCCSAPTAVGWRLVRSTSFNSGL
jgi:hypothetical protein